MLFSSAIIGRLALAGKSPDTLPELIRLEGGYAGSTGLHQSAALVTARLCIVGHMIIHMEPER